MHLAGDDRGWANSGTLSAANGLVLNTGGSVAGFGTIDTPNNVATPLLNSGTFHGNSVSEPLTLPGYVTGAGSLDNVKLTGTYSPGPGPANASLGNAEYDGELSIEIGGTMAGSDFDQVNHILGSGVVNLAVR